MRVIVVGRQGVGKGTQSARLARRLRVPHISTGDQFRAAMNRDSQLGRAVAAFVESGALVPDDLTVQIVIEELKHERARRGFVLDGFPRTLDQAHRLVHFLAPATIDVVIDLRVEPDTLMVRLSRRRVCAVCDLTPEPSEPRDSLPLPTVCGVCGGPLVPRSDDTAATISRRLELFEQQTQPVLDWFAAAGLLRTVDGNGTADEVARRVALSMALVQDYARVGPTATAG